MQLLFFTCSILPRLLCIQCLSETSVCRINYRCPIAFAIVKTDSVENVLENRDRVIVIHVYVVRHCSCGCNTARSVASARRDKAGQKCSRSMSRYFLIIDSRPINNVNYHRIIARPGYLDNFLLPSRSLDRPPDRPQSVRPHLVGRAGQGNIHSNLNEDEFAMQYGNCPRTRSHRFTDIGS